MDYAKTPHDIKRKERKKYKPVNKSDLDIANSSHDTMLLLGQRFEQMQKKKKVWGGKQSKEKQHLLTTA